MSTDRDPAQGTPGAIALLGSGEYLDVMNATDTYLLGTVGGAGTARVALLPTASGLELQGPAYWNGLGLRHFEALGVKDIRPISIIGQASAAEPEQLAMLKDADIYYFSGGNPQHLIETLRGSPAWEIIKGAHARGAVLAGSSAGAMALSGYTIALRQMLAGQKPTWVESLGAAPRLIVFPHFDRMANFIDQVLFQELLSTLPAGRVAVGIDENTALVRVEAPAGNDLLSAARWRVMGQQSVKVFEQNAPPRMLQSGDEILL